MCLIKFLLSFARSQQNQFYHGSWYPASVYVVMKRKCNQENGDCNIVRTNTETLLSLQLSWIRHCDFSPYSVLIPEWIFSFKRKLNLLNVLYRLRTTQHKRIRICTSIFPLSWIRNPDQSLRRSQDYQRMRGSVWAGYVARFRDERFLSQNLQWRGQFGDIFVEWKIILKRTLMALGDWLWIGFSWLSVTTVITLCVS